MSEVDNQEINYENSLEKAHVSYIKKEWNVAINYLIQAYEQDGIWNYNKCELFKKIAYCWIKYEMGVTE